jgi:hypothetical protein
MDQNPSFKNMDFDANRSPTWYLIWYKQLFWQLWVFMGPGDNGWIEAWTQLQIFYGPLILPILTGIYSALICRSEHIGGGWKQLLALPIKRSQVYLSKLTLVFVLLAFTQLLMVVLYIPAGLITGIPGELPWLDLLKFAMLGCIASLPLATIQMIVSTHWRSFGVPLAINIGFAIPAFILSYTKYGQYYPWALPNLAMSPADEAPIQSYPVFYGIVISVFIIALFIGLRVFTKKDMHS